MSFHAACGIISILHTRRNLPSYRTLPTTISNTNINLENHPKDLVQQQFSRPGAQATIREETDIGHIPPVVVSIQRVAHEGLFCFSAACATPTRHSQKPAKAWSDPKAANSSAMLLVQVSAEAAVGLSRKIDEAVQEPAFLYALWVAMQHEYKYKCVCIYVYTHTYTCTHTSCVHLHLHARFSTQN